MSVDANSGARISLHYFEDVLAVEFAAIAQRRAQRPNGLRQGRVARNLPFESPPAAEAQATAGAQTARTNRNRSPDPDALFAKVDAILDERVSGDPHSVPRARPDAIEEDKQRPMPVPCDATGLALSGGGIRSAALGLGVVQALSSVGVLGSFDYLSTVSGGGYIGGALTAGLAKAREPAAIRPPFGDGIEDGPMVAHLRDYSNYLFPRGRSALRNWTDVIAILARGLIANAIPVFATLLLLALVTAFAYPDPTFDALTRGSYLTSVVERFSLGILPLNAAVGRWPFAFTFWLLCFLAFVLIGWALARSASDRARAWSDANSRALTISGILVGAVLVSAFLDLQPVAIHALATVLGLAKTNTAVAGSQFEAPLESVLYWAFKPFTMVREIGGGVSFASAAAALSAAVHVLRTFLAETRNAKGWMALSARFLANTAFIALGAMLAPLALWGAYLYLSVTLIQKWSWFPLLGAAGPIVLFLVLALCAFALDANAYSLLRFYRDRLSRAFLFWFPATGVQTPEYLDDLKLSGLKPSLGPYPIINSALNIEGSKNANKRGRNADFFMFTPDFVGSDLTLYASTEREDDRAPGMEDIEPALDLPTAVAISGAAVSANMGASTVRALSPTLALLNVRLGYWLRNPRYLARNPLSARALTKAASFVVSKLYLLVEIFSLLDETSAHVYLTDGGHIENLGLYELLKRGCKLIVAVDAEADPAMSFGSLQTVERYARIDFGVRIELPWESIAATSLAFDARPDQSQGRAGPHCAVGRIFYPDGAVGVLLYLKASMTGDEKDYILDYKRRNPAFPHETTGDQFFSEEQFEAYRALGFHIAEHFFDQEDDFAYLAEGRGKFGNRAEARAAIEAALPKFVRAGGRQSRPGARGRPCRAAAKSRRRRARRSRDQSTQIRLTTI